jgi:hyperosmotically inducible protein
MALVVTTLSLVSVNAQSFITVNAERSSALSPLEKKVRSEIVKLPRFGLFDNIAFKIDGGTVTLYGKTLSLGTKKSAERVVEKVSGVIEVVNQIEELPPSSFDNQIRRQLVREFGDAPVVGGYISGINPSVKLIVENGRVTLEGNVRNKGDADYMNILANRVPGTFQVTNNLVVGKES